mgnify:CR=1 FL=1
MGGVLKKVAAPFVPAPAVDAALAAPAAVVATETSGVLGDVLTAVVPLAGGEDFGALHYIEPEPPPPPPPVDCEGTWSNYSACGPDHTQPDGTRFPGRYCGQGYKTRTYTKQREAAHGGDDSCPDTGTTMKTTCDLPTGPNGRADHEDDCGNCLETDSSRRQVIDYNGVCCWEDHISEDYPGEQCGCGGEISDCNGVCGGTATYDDCGVCTPTGAPRANECCGREDDQGRPISLDGGEFVRDPPSPGSPAADYDKTQWYIQPGEYDILQGNGLTFMSGDVESCKQKCIDTPECVAFVRATKNQTTGAVIGDNVIASCWLKNAVPMNKRIGSDGWFSTWVHQRNDSVDLGLYKCDCNRGGNGDVTWNFNGQECETYTGPCDTGGDPCSLREVYWQGECVNEGQAGGFECKCNEGTFQNRELGGASAPCEVKYGCNGENNIQDLPGAHVDDFCTERDSGAVCTDQHIDGLLVLPPRCGCTFNWMGDQCTVPNDGCSFPRGQTPIHQLFRGLPSTSDTEGGEFRDRAATYGEAILDPYNDVYSSDDGPPSVPNIPETLDDLFTDQYDKGDFINTVSRGGLDEALRTAPPTHQSRDVNSDWWEDERSFYDFLKIIHGLASTPVCDRETTASCDPAPVPGMWANTCTCNPGWRTCQPPNPQWMCGMDEVPVDVNDINSGCEECSNEGTASAGDTECTCPEVNGYARYGGKLCNEQITHCMDNSDDPPGLGALTRAGELNEDGAAVNGRRCGYSYIFGSIARPYHRYGTCIETEAEEDPGFRCECDIGFTAGEGTAGDIGNDDCSYITPCRKRGGLPVTWPDSYGNSIPIHIDCINGRLKNTREHRFTTPSPVPGEGYTRPPLDTNPGNCWCECEGEWTGASCKYSNQDTCGDRGTVDENGICTCNSGWSTPEREWGCFTDEGNAHSSSNETECLKECLSDNNSCCSVNDGENIITDKEICLHTRDPDNGIGIWTSGTEWKEKDEQGEPLQCSLWCNGADNYIWIDGGDGTGSCQQCENGGTSSPGDNSCSCVNNGNTGYTGTLCNENVNECTNGWHNCSQASGGSESCEDIVGGYLCNCPSGEVSPVSEDEDTEDYCKDPVDGVVSKMYGGCGWDYQLYYVNGVETRWDRRGSCEEIERCGTTDGDYEPTWRWDEDLGGSMITCNDHGTCEEGAGISYTCDCDDGWGGTDCGEWQCGENQIIHNSVCSTCENGSICQDEDCPSAGKCNCPLGYSGVLCDVNTCDVGAESGNYKCRGVLWRGDLGNIPDVDENPGHPNSGVCIEGQARGENNSDGNTCECNDGFTGDDCHIWCNDGAGQSQDNHILDSDGNCVPCENGGISRPGDRKCKCSEHWHGDTCELEGCQKYNDVGDIVRRDGSGEGECGDCTNKAVTSECTGTATEFGKTCERVVGADGTEECPEGCEQGNYLYNCDLFPAGSICKERGTPSSNARQPFSLMQSGTYMGEDKYIRACDADSECGAYEFDTTSSAERAIPRGRGRYCNYSYYGDSTGQSTSKGIEAVWRDDQVDTAYELFEEYWGERAGSPTPDRDSSQFDQVLAAYIPEDTNKICVKRESLGRQRSEKPYTCQCSPGYEGDDCENLMECQPLNVSHNIRTVNELESTLVGAGNTLYSRLSEEWENEDDIFCRNDRTLKIGGGCIVACKDGFYNNLEGDTVNSAWEASPTDSNYNIGYYRCEVHEEPGQSPQAILVPYGINCLNQTSIEDCNAYVNECIFNGEIPSSESGCEDAGCKWHILDSMDSNGVSDGVCLSDDQSGKGFINKYDTATKMDMWSAALGPLPYIYDPTKERACEIEVNGELRELSECNPVPQALPQGAFSSAQAELLEAVEQEQEEIIIQMEGGLSEPELVTLQNRLYELQLSEAQILEGVGGNKDAQYILRDINLWKPADIGIPPTWIKYSHNTTEGCRDDSGDSLVGTGIPGVVDLENCKDWCMGNPQICNAITWDNNDNLCNMHLYAENVRPMREDFDEQSTGKECHYYTDQIPYYVTKEMAPYGRECDDVSPCSSYVCGCNEIVDGGISTPSDTNCRLYNTPSQLGACFDKDPFDNLDALVIDADTSEECTSAGTGSHVWVDNINTARNETHQSVMVDGTPMYGWTNNTDQSNKPCANIITTETDDFTLMVQPGRCSQVSGHNTGLSPTSQDVLNQEKSIITNTGGYVNYISGNEANDEKCCKKDINRRWCKNYSMEGGEPRPYDCLESEGYQMNEGEGDKYISKTLSEEEKKELCCDKIDGEWCSNYEGGTFPCQDHMGYINKESHEDLFIGDITDPDDPNLLDRCCNKIDGQWCSNTSEIDCIERPGYSYDASKEEYWGGGDDNRDIFFAQCCNRDNDNFCGTTNFICPQGHSIAGILDPGPNPPYTGLIDPTAGETLTPSNDLYFGDSFDSMPFEGTSARDNYIRFKNYCCRRTSMCIGNDKNMNDSPYSEDHECVEDYHIGVNIDAVKVSPGGDECCSSKDTCFDSYYGLNSSETCGENYIYDINSNRTRCQVQENIDVVGGTNYLMDESVLSCDFQGEDQDNCCVKNFSEFFRLSCGNQIQAYEDYINSISISSPKTSQGDCLIPNNCSAQEMNEIHFTRLNNLTHNQEGLKKYYEKNGPEGPEAAFLTQDMEGSGPCAGNDGRWTCSSGGMSGVNSGYNFIVGCDIGGDVNTTVQLNNRHLTVNELINNYGDLIPMMKDTPSTCSETTEYNVKHTFDQEEYISDNPFITEDNIEFSLYCNDGDILYKVKDDECIHEPLGGGTSGQECTSLNANECMDNINCSYIAPTFGCLPDVSIYGHDNTFKNCSDVVCPLPYEKKNQPNNISCMDGTELRDCKINLELDDEDTGNCCVIPNRVCQWEISDNLRYCKTLGSQGDGSRSYDCGDITSMEQCEVSWFENDNPPYTGICKWDEMRASTARCYPEIYSLEDGIDRPSSIDYGGRSYNCPEDRTELLDRPERGIISGQNPDKNCHEYFDSRHDSRISEEQTLRTDYDTVLGQVELVKDRVNNLNNFRPENYSLQFYGPFNIIDSQLSQIYSEMNILSNHDFTQSLIQIQDSESRYWSDRILSDIRSRIDNINHYINTINVQVDYIENESSHIELDIGSGQATARWTRSDPPFMQPADVP